MTKLEATLRSAFDNPLTAPFVMIRREPAIGPGRTQSCYVVHLLPLRPFPLTPQHMCGILIYGGPGLGRLVCSEFGSFIAGAQVARRASAVWSESATSPQENPPASMMGVRRKAVSLGLSR